jgi:hypothetical protein
LRLFAARFFFACQALLFVAHAHGFRLGNASGFSFAPFTRGDLSRDALAFAFLFFFASALFGFHPLALTLAFLCESSLFSRNAFTFLLRLLRGDPLAFTFLRNTALFFGDTFVLSCFGCKSLALSLFRLPTLLFCDTALFNGDPGTLCFFRDAPLLGRDAFLLLAFALHAGARSRFLSGTCRRSHSLLVYHRYHDAGSDEEVGILAGARFNDVSRLLGRSGLDHQLDVGLALHRLVRSKNLYLVALRVQFIDEGKRILATAADDSG